MSFNESEWNQIKFRFEIQYQDGTVAATALSDLCVSFAQNERKTIQMSMDTSHLAAGRYKADIVAYVYDQFGTEQFVDGVFPGFLFEIDNTVDEYQQLTWLHQYWGHVRLHDIQILNAKS